MYKMVEIAEKYSKLKESVLLLFSPTKLSGKDRLPIKCTYVVSTTTNCAIYKERKVNDDNPKTRLRQPG